MKIARYYAASAGCGLGEEPGLLEPVSDDPCIISNGKYSEACMLAMYDNTEENLAKCGAAAGETAALGCKVTSANQALMAAAMEGRKITITTETGSGGKTGLTKMPGTTASSTPGSCASMIPTVQAAIGVNPDGQWGPKSQAALAARGGDFRAFAPGCAGDVPWYSATGKKAPAASATQVTTQVAPNVVVAAPQGQFPWNKVAMGVVAVGIVAALYYAVKK